MKQASLLLLLLLFSPPFTVAQVNQIDGGFIKHWLILGPFSGNEIDQDYLESVGGEASMDPKVGDTVKTTQGETLTWSLYRSQGDIVDLLQAVGDHNNVTAYAFCHLQGKQDTDINVLLGSDDGVAVWFNGKLVHKNSINRVLVIDQDGFSVQVKKRLNPMLVKITRSNSDWGFACRFPLLVSGRLLMLDRETPHQNVVVQALKDGRVLARC